MYTEFNNEFHDGKQHYCKDLHDVPPQGKIIGVIGRYDSKNKHWSSNDGPREIMFLDPLPAACGGKIDKSVNISETNVTDDMMTATHASDYWNYNWVVPLSDTNNFQITREYHGSNSNARKSPGLYFRYFLGTVQNGVIKGLQMDYYGGHTQPDGDWHIHINTSFETGYEDCVIGYAVDGVPIIGGSSNVLDSNGVSLGIASSSWRRRTESEYTDINSKNGNGYFIYDYLFDETIGNLDRFNGGYMVLDGELTYSYFTTSTYPIWPRNLRGKVNNLQYNDTTHDSNAIVCVNIPSILQLNYTSSSLSYITRTQDIIIKSAFVKWCNVLQNNLPIDASNNIISFDIISENSQVLGSAQIIEYNDSGFPKSGELQLNSFYFDNEIDRVVLHEVGHLIGIGPMWVTPGNSANSNISGDLYIGRNATNRYKEYCSLYNIDETYIQGIPIEDLSLIHI